MAIDQVFETMLADLRELEGITEDKIQAAIAREPSALIQALQQQIDPQVRLQSHTLDIGLLSEAQRAELKTHITRWAGREQYLTELLQKNLGYILYLRHLIGLSNDEHQSGLDLGL